MSMRIIQQFKNVFVARKETRIQDVDLKPGDVFHAQDENGKIGSFGCVYATQVETNRQLEHKPQLLIP